MDRTASKTVLVLMSGAIIVLFVFGYYIQTGKNEKEKEKEKVKDFDNKKIKKDKQVEYKTVMGPKQVLDVEVFQEHSFRFRRSKNTIITMKSLEALNNRDNIIKTVNEMKKTKPDFEDVVVNPKKRLKRIKKEYELLKSLPLEFGSSIFLRYESDNLDIMKALIVGPSDTPYANGLYEFDIFLPANFPMEAPFIQFITTGNGSVRFNPNLYEDGRVCLSLLNTFVSIGSFSEWNNESTILQILISIQGLILVEKPYFNEPGAIEDSKGTPAGERAGERYNADLRYQTLKWGILDKLEELDKKKKSNKVLVFSDVISEHFRIKADVIEQQLENWSKNTSGIQLLIPKIRNHLKKLKGYDFDNSEGHVLGQLSDGNKTEPLSLDDIRNARLMKFDSNLRS